MHSTVLACEYTQVCASQAMQGPGILTNALLLARYARGLRTVSSCLGTSTRPTGLSHMLIPCHHLMCWASSQHLCCLHHCLPNTCAQSCRKTKHHCCAAAEHTSRASLMTGDDSNLSRRSQWAGTSAHIPAAAQQRILTGAHGPNNRCRQSQGAGHIQTRKPHIQLR